jgi:hypothetical protein
MTLEQSQTAEATESQARFSAEEVREILSIASNLQESTFSAEQVRAIARDSGIADENLERAFELYRQRRAVEEQRKRKAAVRKRWLTLIATVVAATIGFAGALTYTATQVEQATTKVERQLLAASPTCSVYLEARESWGSPREKRLIIQLSNGPVFVLDDFFRHVSFASVPHLASMLFSRTGCALILSRSRRGLTASRHSPLDSGTVRIAAILCNSMRSRFLRGGQRETGRMCFCWLPQTVGQ